MELGAWAFLAGSGIAAGVINTVAGGGSVLTLPALLFAGLPAHSANATNRIGILAQNTVAIHLFRKRGYAEGPLTWRMTLVGLVGSAAGAWLATLVSPQKFEVLLGWLMLVLIPVVLWKPGAGGVLPAQKGTADSWTPLARGNQVVVLFASLLLGVYAGFIQAGIGVMILLVLSRVARMDLVRGNFAKLVFIEASMVFAMAVFLYRDVPIAWGVGLLLAGTQMVGAWIGTGIVARGGEPWIRRFMVLAILLGSGKLLFW